MHDEIQALELRLLEPSARRSPDELARLISDEFVEFGAFGLVYRKQDVLDWLPSADSIDFSVTEFSVRELAPDVALATYRAEERSPGKDTVRKTLRSSIWKRGSDGWQMIFHQGTRSATP
jgi:hypothetical protein